MNRMYVYNLCPECIEKVNDNTYEVTKIQNIKFPFSCEWCSKVSNNGATWRFIKIMEDEK